MSNKIKSKYAKVRKEAEVAEAMVDIYALIAGISKKEAAEAIAAAETAQAGG